jgi:hypothetical protein
MMGDLWLEVGGWLLVVRGRWRLAVDWLLVVRGRW